MTDGPPLDRTLDPAAFYSLYRGALAAESVERRLKRCYVVLLAGRLGLRPGEILHCHEGWVDWGRGEVRIPALDPCACGECWANARARQAAGDERDLAEILCDEQWSPGTAAGTRTVAFGWSERTTAVLASVFDYFDVLDCDRRELGRLVAGAAADAEGIDPEGLTPWVLRATGGRFFADVGFDATSVQRLLGLDDRAVAEAYVSAAGQRTSAGIYRIFDRDAIGPDVPPANPARRFPIACDPAPFSREPFTPADFDAAERRHRGTSEAGDRVRNPRTATVPDGIEYDPESHRLAAQADPEGGQFSTTAGSDVPDVAALRDWIARRDASLRADSDLDGSSQGVAPGMDHEARDPVSPGAGPPAEPDPASSGGPGDGPLGGQGGGPRGGQDDGSVGGSGAGSVGCSGAGSPADGARRVATDGATAGVPGEAVGGDAWTGRTRGSDGADGADGASKPGVDSSPPETVTDAVTEPVVASVGTRFVAPGVAGGRPVEGRVVLGQDELLLVRPGSTEALDDPAVEYEVVALDAVVDVVPDASPEGVPFESTLGVCRRRADGHDVVVLEFAGQRKWDFWLAVFRNALHVSQMQVTHPARVGGRVTEATATPGMVYLDRDRVRLTPLGSDSTLVRIDLDEVLHVERTRQDVAGDRQPALAIQRFVEGEAVTSLVGSNSLRTLSLFERFVRRDYRERLESARSLAIPDPEKEVLVALYSAGDRVDLTDVFRRDDAELRASVASLESKGLVTAAALAETDLTAKGRLVVSDRLEAVND